MVFTRPGVVEMLDVDEPDPQEGDVLIDVAAVGICGSELHGIGSVGFRQPPLILGHEFVGTADDGRRVAVNPVVACGNCDLCAREMPQLCRDRIIIGIHRPGAFAERTAVPGKAVYELPEGLSWDVGALIEPLANGLHAWKVAGSPTSGRVGVLGAGTIGLATLLVLKRAGVEVAISDLAPERLELAERLGAKETGPALEGEFDVVIDAVGAPATHRASLERLAPGGTAVWLGLLSAEAGFDAQDVVRGHKTVKGSFCYSNAEFGEAVQMAAEVDLTWGTAVPLAQGAEVFTELMNGRTDIVKAVLHP